MTRYRCQISFIANKHKLLSHFYLYANLFTAVILDSCISYNSTSPEGYMGIFGYQVHTHGLGKQVGIYFQDAVSFSHDIVTSRSESKLLFIHITFHSLGIQLNQGEQTRSSLKPITQLQKLAMHIMVTNFIFGVYLIRVRKLAQLSQVIGIYDEFK